MLKQQLPEYSKTAKPSCGAFSLAENRIRVHPCSSVVSSLCQRGVALVITLIMLSVITVVAVTFLALSRRERSSITQTLNLTDDKAMNDTALERAKAQIFTRILATTNMLNGDFAVSRNFINTNGFQPGVSSFLNVSYTYPNGELLN